MIKLGLLLLTFAVAAALANQNSAEVFSQPSGLFKLVRKGEQPETLVDEGATLTTHTIELKETISESVTVELRVQRKDGADSRSGLSTCLKSLQFTPQDKDKPKNVFVSGEEDDEFLGATVAGEVFHKITAIGKDLDKAGETLDAFNITFKDNDNPGVVYASEPLSMREGQTKEVKIKLASQPTGTVQIDIGSSELLAISLTNPQQDDESGSKLIFDGTTWSTERRLAVMVSEDNIARQESTVNVTVAVNKDATTAPYYKTAADTPLTPLQIKVSDNDVAGLIVSTDPSALRSENVVLKLRECLSSESAEECKRTDFYFVRLASQPLPGEKVTVLSFQQPAGQVVVTTDAADAEGAIVFDDSNWNVSTKISATVLDDNVDEADTTDLTITHTSSAGETAQTYVGQLSAEVTVTVSDNDNARVVSSLRTLQVTENGDGMVYEVNLGSKPQGKVTIRPEVQVIEETEDGPKIPIDPTNGYKFEFEPEKLDFMPIDWNTPQTIRVKAPDDDKITCAKSPEKAGCTNVRIQHAITSADDEMYNQKTDINVPLFITTTIIENDFAGIRVPNFGALGALNQPAREPAAAKGMFLKSQVQEEELQYSVDLGAEPNEDVTVTVKAAINSTDFGEGVKPSITALMQSTVIEVPGGVTGNLVDGVQWTIAKANWKDGQDITLKLAKGNSYTGNFGLRMDHTLTSDDVNFNGKVGSDVLQFYDQVEAGLGLWTSQDASGVKKTLITLREEKVPEEGKGEVTVYLKFGSVVEQSSTATLSMDFSRYRWKGLAGNAQTEPLTVTADPGDDWTTGAPLEQTVTIQTIDNDIQQPFLESFLNITYGGSDVVYGNLPVTSIPMRLTDDDQMQLRFKDASGIEMASVIGLQEDSVATISVEPMKTLGENEDSLVVTLTSDTACAAGGAQSVVCLAMDQASLTFNKPTGGGIPAPQSVELTIGNDDALAQKVVTFTATFQTNDQQNPPQPKTVSQSITINVADNDIPAINLFDISGASNANAAAEDVTADNRHEVKELASETGSRVYSAGLTTAPSDDVTVDIEIVGAGADRVTISPTKLTFTPANFATRQTITLTVPDDDSAKGNVPFTVEHDVSSIDPNYDAVATRVANMKLVDEESIGIECVNLGAQKICQSSAEHAAAGTVEATVSEDGKKGGFPNEFSYGLKLKSQPKNEVTVKVITAGFGNVNDLKFTAANWQTQQDVTLTVTNNNVRDGDRVGTVKHEADSADDDYKFTQQTLQAAPANLRKLDAGELPEAKVNIKDEEEEGYDFFPCMDEPQYAGNPCVKNVALKNVALNTSLVEGEGGYRFCVELRSVPQALVKLKFTNSYGSDDAVVSATLPPACTGANCFLLDNLVTFKEKAAGGGETESDEVTVMVDGNNGGECHEVKSVPKDDTEQDEPIVQLTVNCAASSEDSTECSAGTPCDWNTNAPSPPLFEVDVIDNDHTPEVEDTEIEKDEKTSNKPSYAIKLDASDIDEADNGKHTVEVTGFPDDKFTVGLPKVKDGTCCGNPANNPAVVNGAFTLTNVDLSSEQHFYMKPLDKDTFSSPQERSNVPDGKFSFKFVVRDENGAAPQKTVSLQIDDVNDAPVVAQSQTWEFPPAAFGQEQKMVIVKADADQKDGTPKEELKVLFVTKPQNGKDFGTHSGIGYTDEFIDGVTKSVIEGNWIAEGFEVAYTPKEDMAHDKKFDSFTFKVLDPEGLTSELATVDIRVDCPAGRSLKHNEKKCELCRPGTFTGEANEQLCHDCQPGQFAANTGATGCQACAVTEFNPDKKQKECAPCPPNMETGRVGALTQDQCRCMPGFFGENGNDAGCTQCQENTDCSRPGQLWPIAEVGFYLDPQSDPNKVVKCTFDAFNACPKHDYPGEEQGEKWDVIGECGTGYSGFSCSKCDCKIGTSARCAHDIGFYKEYDKCSMCPENNYIFYLVIFLMIGVFIPGLYFASKMKRGFGSISIAINYAQLTAFFIKFDLRWPESLKEYFKMFSFLNFNLDLMQPECSIPYEYSVKWQTLLFAPLLFVGAIMGIGIAVWAYTVFMARVVRLHKVFHDVRQTIRAKKKVRGFFRRIIAVPLRFMKTKQELIAFFGNTGRLLLMVCALAYSSLASNTLEWVDCSDASTASVERFTLDADPSIECYVFDSETDNVNAQVWVRLFPMFCAAVVFYVIGIPVFIFYSLHKHRNYLRQKKIRRTYGALINKYDEDFYYWEVMVMLRKLSILLIKIFAANKIIEQVLLALIVLLVALLAQVFARPFESTLLDRMESMLICSSFVTLFSGFLFRANVSKKDDSLVGLMPASFHNALTFFNVGIILVSFMCCGVFLLLDVFPSLMSNIRIWRKERKEAKRKARRTEGDDATNVMLFKAKNMFKMPKKKDNDAIILDGSREIFDKLGVAAVEKFLEDASDAEKQEYADVVKRLANFSHKYTAAVQRGEESNPVSEIIRPNVAPRLLEYMLVCDDEKQRNGVWKLIDDCIQERRQRRTLIQTRVWRAVSKTEQKAKKGNLLNKIVMGVEEDEGADVGTSGARVFGTMASQLKLAAAAEKKEAEAKKEEAEA